MMDNTLELTGSSKISTSTLVRISKLELKNSSNNVETSSNIDGNIKGLMKTIFTGSGTATFTGTVVNMGSTEAILSTINLMNESNNSSPTCITMSIDGLKVGDKLTPSQEQNFTVTVTSTCTEASTKTNEFSLSYIPVNPTDGTTTIDERITNLESQITAQQTQITKLQEENQGLKDQNNLLQQGLSEVNGKFQHFFKSEYFYWHLKQNLIITFPKDRSDNVLLEIRFLGGYNLDNMGGVYVMRIGFKLERNLLFGTGITYDKAGEIAKKLTFGDLYCDSENAQVKIPITALRDSQSYGMLFVTVYSIEGIADKYSVRMES